MKVIIINNIINNIVIISGNPKKDYLSKTLLEFRSNKVTYLGDSNHYVFKHVKKNTKPNFLGNPNFGTNNTTNPGGSVSTNSISSGGSSSGGTSGGGLSGNGLPDNLSSNTSGSSGNSQGQII